MIKCARAGALAAERMSSKGWLDEEPRRVMTDVLSQQLIADLVWTAGKGEVTLDQGLAHYETIYMPARNLAAKTRVNYRNDIADLIAFLK